MFLNELYEYVIRHREEFKYYEDYKSYLFYFKENYGDSKKKTK